MQSKTQSVAKRLVAVYVLAIVVLAGIVIASLNGVLTSRGFGVAGFSFMVCFALIFTMVLRQPKLGANNADNYPSDPAPAADSIPRQRTVRKIRQLQFLVAVLIFCLIYGLWNGRHGPVPPIVVGCVMNLAFTAGALLAIRQLQKNLK